MNITVDYKKRHYGLGDDVRSYKLTIKEVNGFYSEKPITTNSKFYQTDEIQICFRGNTSAPGRSWDDFSEAEVLGGRLELSHNAARALANSILRLLDQRKEKGFADKLELEINETPEPRSSRPESEK